MADRYFVESPVTGSQALLIGPEAHHLAHVMRARPGNVVTLFDGQGDEFVCRVEQVGRSQISLAVLERLAIDRELPCRIHLAAALPKGDRQKWLVEKATELGVARLVPLETARGVAQPAEGTLERLRRVVVEASKQCGRNRLMEIAAAHSWPALVAAAPTTAPRGVAHPGQQAVAATTAPGVSGDPTAQASCDGPASPLRVPCPENSWWQPFRQAGEVWLAIGPEGGLTADEVALAEAAGWRTIDLGSRILRVETAAVALVAALSLGPGGG